MFQLHARSRRFLVLLLFAAACVAPTLGVAAWCVWNRLPWRTRAEAVWIDHLWGMNASLKDLGHPRPGQTQYIGLALAERESGAAVFSCRRLDLREGQADPAPTPFGTASDSTAPDRTSRKQDDAQAGRRPAVFVEFQAGQCRAASWDEWVRVAESLLACRIGASFAELRCTGDRLEIVGDGRSWTMFDVHASVSRTGEQTTLSLSFRPDGAPAASRSRLVVVRRRDASTPTTQWELTCDDGAPLPCALLAGAAPALASAGDASEFVGRMVGHQASDGWHYELARASLRNLDLDRLVGDRLRPLRLSGLADVQIDRATASGGRLISAEGAVEAEGRASRALAESCLASWGLDSAAPPSGGDLRIGRCQAYFLLDDRGLQLLAFENNGRSVAFDASDRPLVDAPPPKSIIPLASLLDAFSPRGETTSGDMTIREALRRRLPLAEDRAVAERTPRERR